MAKITGSVGANSSAYEFYIEWTESEVDAGNNTSKVTATSYIKCTAHTAYDNATYTHSITIDGTKYNTSVAGINLSAGVTIKLASASKVITHNSDGSKSIAISASSPNLPSGGGWGPVSGTASGNAGLTIIPRASGITALDASIESATNIVIDKKSTNFTTTVKYAFGSLNGVIADKTENPVIPWIIPASFYTQIPNAKTGVCTLTCETYSGNTLIGNPIPTTFKVSVDPDKNKPDVSADIVDSNATTVALTGDKNKLVKFFSNVQVTISAIAKNSATISSKKVTCGDGKSLTDNGTMNAVESGNFNVSATDSREFSKAADVVKTLINYVKLTLNVDVYRPLPTTGEVAMKFSGNYFNGNFGGVVNTLDLKYRYRLQGGAWSDYITLNKTINNNTYDNGNGISLGTGFNYQNIYEFEIVATDKLYPALTVSKTVLAGEPVFAGLKNAFKVFKQAIFNGNLDVKGDYLKNGQPFIINGNTLDPVPDFNQVAVGQVLNKSTVNTANVANVWYNLINLRHRNGIGDGTNYGMQIRSPLTDNNAGLEYRKQTNGVWSDWKRVDGGTTYRVGDIIMSTSNANPNANYGGAWVAWGSERVPVGMGGKYGAVEAAGGADSIALDTSNIPSHTHSFSFTTSNGGAHTHQYKYYTGATTGSYDFQRPYTATTYVTGTGNGPSAGDHNHTGSGTTGGTGSGAGHENRQQFITCYMWKKTAN